MREGAGVRQSLTLIAPLMSGWTKRIALMAFLWASIAAAIIMRVISQRNRSRDHTSGSRSTGQLEPGHETEQMEAEQWRQSKCGRVHTIWVVRCSVGRSGHATSIRSHCHRAIRERNHQR